MKTGRKFLVQLCGVAMAVLILYAVSSGPMIRYSSLAPSTAVKVNRSPDPSGADSRPLTAQDYFKKVEPHSIDSRPNPTNYVQEFYRPLVKTAYRLRLDSPLSAYLHVWRVFIIHTKGDHFFFVVFNG